MLPLLNILKEFESIGLATAEKQDFMNRTDLKYSVASHRLPDILQNLKDNYYILSIKDNSTFTYTTSYYDTKAYDFYLAHHNGRANRFKVRKRTYLESDLTYLEIKFRQGINGALKKRMLIKNDESQIENEFIANNIPFQLRQLVPTANVNYTRITLINKVGFERVTIDTNLEFLNESKIFKFQNIAILEVKQILKSRTAAIELLQIMQIKPGSFSKYCMAINYLYPELKKNNFKRKNHQLEYLGHISAPSLFVNA